MATFLSKLEQEMPFVVWGNQFYEIGESDNKAKNHVNLLGNKKKLRPLSPIVEWEEIYVQESFANQLDRETTNIEQELIDINERVDSMASRSVIATITQQNQIEGFIYTVLNSWSRAGRIDRTIPKPKKLPKLAKLEKVKFHSSNTPVLPTALETTPALFMNKNLYLGFARESHFTVTLGGKTYALLHHSSTSKFDKCYQAALKERQAKRVKEVFGNYRQNLEKLAADLNGTAADLTLPSENRTNEVGFKKVDDDYYIYINQKSFTIYSAAAGSHFRFPSCQIGIRIFAKNGKLDYDRSSESGRLRILAAKRIENGKEVGALESLYGKSFKFPASITTKKIPFPLLCVTGSGHKWPIASSTKPLESCVRQVLRDASRRMEFGYRDSGAGATLYSYLTDECYENHKT